MSAERPRESDGPSRPGYGWRIAAVLGCGVYLPVVAGFALHTSPPAGVRFLGKYSPLYAVFLLILMVGAAAIPWVARALARPTRLERPDGTTVLIGGQRKAGFAAAVAVAGVVAAGAAVELVGAARRLAAEGGRGRELRHCEVFFDEWSARSHRQNAYGWLGPEITRSKPAGTYRVFTLGGSTTFLENLIDNPTEKHFTALLQTSLQEARPAWRIEVVNAAANAHTSMQSLIKYVTLIRDLQPDLVLVMHAVNEAQEGAVEEHVLAWKRPYERDYMHDARALLRWSQQGGLGRPQRPLWREGRVVSAVQQGLRNTFASDLRRRAPLTALERRRLAELEALAPRDSFIRNERTLARLLRADGVRFGVMSQPTMFRPGGIDGGVGYLTPDDAAVWRFRGRRERVYDETWMRVLARLNAAARGVAREENGLFVDLEAAVPPDWACFYLERADGVHMNERGCALAAEALHAAVLPLIPPRPSPAGAAEAP